jgi:hypothetical protein
MSRPTVPRIWKRSVSNRGRSTFKLSADPLFVDEVKDIVALYLNPPGFAAIVCVDEKRPCRLSTGPSRSSAAARHPRAGWHH